MIEVKGRYGTAKVFNDVVEETALEQIKVVMNQKMVDGAKVRIMSDVHAGAGCVIGYTATMTDRVCVNLIGVDIGCGVLAYKLTNKVIDFKKLDRTIKDRVPTGFNIHSEINLDFVGSLGSEMEVFYKNVLNVCKETKQDYDYAMRSLGTLGDGNHYIEIDKNIETGELYLMIHTGSRKFGFNVANHFQNLAVENCTNKVDVGKIKNDLITSYREAGKEKEIQAALAEIDSRLFPSTRTVPEGMEFIQGKVRKDYLRSMMVAQRYAELNREYIARIILKYSDLFACEKIESVHNYIDRGHDFTGSIIRKGAISAFRGEEVLIPLNMADGTLLGTGKGNPDWNFSAPHGAGRLMSRKKARRNIDITDYQERMKDVWSSCVNLSTIDEAPMAYKNADEIKKYIEPTVSITAHLKPVYNLKANDYMKRCLFKGE